MPLRPHSTAPAPDDVRLPGAAEPAPDSVPTLRQILERYRQQGTAPGQLAAAAPPPASAPKLASLRSLFLDSTGEPTLAPVARDDDPWARPAPSRAPDAMCRWLTRCAKISSAVRAMRRSSTIRLRQ